MFLEHLGMFNSYHSSPVIPPEFAILLPQTLPHTLPQALSHRVLRCTPTFIIVMFAVCVVLSVLLPFTSFYVFVQFHSLVHLAI